jgi:monovalent cation:H+ antiporter, CPA1 family
MVVIQFAAVLLTLVALIAYLNYRYVRLPNTLVVMIAAAIVSLLMVLLGKSGWGSLVYQANIELARVSDYPVLMQALLGLLLFAAAIQINLAEFNQQRIMLGSIALVGSIISMLLIGAVLWVILQGFGIATPFGYCLLFGTLIMPTDSTGITGALRAIRLARVHETTIIGESVLNNIVTLIAFLIVLITVGVPVPQSTLPLWLLQHIGGGLMWGGALGWLLYTLLKNIDQHMPLALWLTVSLALGGQAVAYWLDFSAPLSLVIAGLFVARSAALPETNREQLRTFWGVLAEVIVVGLLVLLGLEVLRISVHIEYLLVALALIPLVLLARFVGTGLPLLVWQRFRRFSPVIKQVMTWGAMHGGVSVALFLTLPEGPVRNLMLVLTYSVIIVSVVAQGLTLARVLDEAA